MATPAVSALSAYRTLLRATRIAFEGAPTHPAPLNFPPPSFPLQKLTSYSRYPGDVRTLHAARVECRKHFNEHRRPGVDTPMRIQGALEAAHMLRTNVVQGVREARVGEGGKVEESYSKWSI